jgi:hypothetical protein
MKEKEIPTYVIKYEDHKIDSCGWEGYIRCHHISDTPVFCLNMFHGTFYGSKEIAEDFALTMQNYYKDLFLFTVIEIKLKIPTNISIMGGLKNDKLKLKEISNKL